VRPLSIPGAWEIAPAVFGVPGRLFADYGAPALAGHGLELPHAQLGVSVSARGVVRGIHFSVPAQVKYVVCVHGSAFDVVVDLRPGSPTFGRWDAVRLDGRQAVYIGEGLGHGFMALEDDTTMFYLCSRPYDPGAEREISPLDPELGIRWPLPDPELSPRDRAAPTLAQFSRRGAA
jgi:dTDP-4-dehydrorhamnose 3,5-epimerase